MNGPFKDLGVAILGPFPPRPGGVSVQCEILASKLIEAGARVTRINTDIPVLRRRGHGGRAFLPAAQIARLVQELHRTCDHWHILHVHAASWWGFMPAVIGVWARRWRKRLVLSYHGGEAEAFLGRWSWLARPVLWRYDALLTLTPTQARIFARRGLTARVIPNVVPVEDFGFHPRGPLAPKLLWLRQLEPRYRPGDALSVLARVQAQYPQATLTLAGGGSLEADLRSQVAAMGLDGVIFTGHLPAQAIPAAYDEAEIFLNTSAVDNLPLSLIEAGASGLPIVTTAAGAIPDLITDGENGLLTPVGDAAALASAVLRLLAEPALARRLSLAAHEHAQRFAWHCVAPQLAAVYAPDTLENTEGSHHVLRI